MRNGGAAHKNIERRGVYMRRCPKMAFQSPVTSHQSLLIPSYSSLATSYQPLVTKLLFRFLQMLDGCAIHIEGVDKLRDGLTWGDDARKDSRFDGWQTALDERIFKE